MEIAVLLKQVPATESMIEISDDGSAIKTEGINWVMNPYDEMAVEEALQIRADTGGTVTVFSLGPEKAVEALRTALAMGADTAVRIDPEGKPLDGLATAKVLAGELKKGAFDLIVGGVAYGDDICLSRPAHFFQGSVAQATTTGLNRLSRGGHLSRNVNRDCDKINL